MGGLFGGRKSAPAPKPEPKPEPTPEPTRVDRRAEEQAASLRSRRRGGARSLLSPAREEAQTGLSTKLGGGA
jgi:hypothetical protein